MRALRVLIARFLGILPSARHEREMDAELEALVQLHVDDYVRAGMTPATARRQALIRLGGLQSVKDAHRDQRGLPLLETTMQDIRFGARMLLRHKSYTAVAVLTLALGIATTTTMFSIVDAALLRPFQFASADRLVMIWEINPARGITRFNGSAANYADWQTRATTFSDLGAWRVLTDSRTDGPVPERVIGAVASAPFFRALGISPAAGRFFRDDEDRPAGRLVAVLGYEYRARAFAAGEDVLGRSVVINGEAHRIVGVMPPLRPPFRADVWRPLAADVAELDRGNHDLLVIGRLAPGQTMTSAEAELKAIAAQLSDAFAQSNRGWSVRAESIYQALVPERTRRSMLTLLAAVALLLLISCVNVASLTLARATSRVRELSTRFALGAGRRRLLRQLFTESVLLAMASAVLGIVAATWLIDLVQWVYPTDVPGVADAHLNQYAVAFAVAIASLTTIVFGLVPAYQISRQLTHTPHLSTRSATASPRVNALRHAFAAAEVALALVLLVGSGLLLVTVNRLLNVPLGFGADQVVTGRVTFTDRRYDDDAHYIGFVKRLLDELHTRAGVAAAGFSSSVPFDNAYTVMQVRDEADRDKPDAEGVLAQWRVIGGDYLSAVRIPLLSGRIFSDADASGIPRVTIISQSLARQLFGQQDPLDRHILVGDARRPYRIVGIAGAARLTALDSSPEPTMYFHYQQFGWPSMTIAVRSAGDPEALNGVVRSAVSAADPSLAVFDERPLREVVDAAATAPRMNATLLSMFGVLALTLAAVGVYGTMNYAALQRTPEISLRLVLGARPANVFVLMVRKGVQITLIGVGIGTAVAAAAAGSLRSLLFEVSARDVWVYSGAAAFVFAVAVVACCIPALRVMRADPVTVLRTE